MTFLRQKAHRDSEVVKLRPSRPLHLLHTPRASFLNAAGVCVCVCVCMLLACPQDHRHVLLMPKMGAPKVQYLDGLQCSPPGHSEGVRGWRSVMKQTRRAGWQAWENLYRHHSVKGGWFICVLNFKNWSQVHIFIHYLVSVWSREEVAFPAVVCSMDACLQFWNIRLIIKIERKKKRSPFG